MNTVKQFIKDSIKQLDPSLDTSDTSALTDLLINPASAMLDPVIAQINYILDSLGLKNPEELDADALDQIGSNFLVSRDVGSKAAGYIECYYNTPQTVFIAKGTLCAANGGQTYQVTKDVYVPIEVMAEHTWSFPLYSTGAIPVESSVVGSGQSLMPNNIVSIDLSPAPVRVTNPSSFTGGSAAETNRDFVTRLTTEVINGALGSADSIRSTLMKNFPTIQGVQVKGMADTEMLRDIILSGVSPYGLYTNIDYFGRVSGLNSLPYPESSAYWSVYYDEPTTSGLIYDLPLIEEFYDEFSTDQYVGMYRLDDSAKAEIQSLTILDEPFEGSLNPRWHKTDGMIALDALKNINEIQVIQHNGLNKLQLGDTASTEAEIRQVPITMPIEFLYSILNMMYRVSTMPPSVSTWQPPYIDTYQELVDILTYLYREFKKFD
jgi:hypothetical protein